MDCRLCCVFFILRHYLLKQTFCFHHFNDKRPDLINCLLFILLYIIIIIISLFHIHPVVTENIYVGLGDNMECVYMHPHNMIYNVILAI